MRYDLKRSYTWHPSPRVGTLKAQDAQSGPRRMQSEQFVTLKEQMGKRSPSNIRYYMQ